MAAFWLVGSVAASQGQQASAVENNVSLSKVGFLTAGGQIEWVITATGDGSSVTLVDEISNRLVVDGVDAPGASVRIDGQTVSVTYISLDGTQQFSILTTPVQKQIGANTVCQSGTDNCASGSVMTELPRTGQTPLWRSVLLGTLVAVAVMFILSVALRDKFISQPRP